MRLKSIFTLALMLATTAAQAQIKVSLGKDIRKDTIDQKRLIVQYDMQAVIDLNEADQPLSETLRLDIGQSTSRFYSYTAFLQDSILAADFAAGASMEVIQQHAQQYQSQWSEETFKHYPEGMTTTLDAVAGQISLLRCEEPEETPRWTLTADTLTVLGYRCTRATTDFKGRTWTAWFAPDIPLSEGPWKLCGLPGLILKAEDAEGHYRFTANGIEQPHTPTPILYGGRDYEPVSRKQYAKVHERFATDPVGFITSTMPNVKVTVSDKHGNPTRNPKDTPYNPIER